MAGTRKRARRIRVEPWVGAWLREHRTERGKENIGHVAGRLNLTISVLSRIERGESLFPSDELPKFLAAYRVTLADFATADRAHRRQLAVKAAA